MIREEKYNLLIEMFDDLLTKKNDELKVKDYEIKYLRDKIDKLEEKLITFDN